jgi:hypothetical protein
MHWSNHDKLAAVASDSISQDEPWLEYPIRKGLYPVCLFVGSPSIIVLNYARPEHQMNDERSSDGG